MSHVDVVAALLVDEREHVLMVRKRDTATFMQPGGKLEPEEDPLDGLRRELVEELCLSLPRDRFAWLGHHEAAAANEPGFTVRADVWHVRLTAADEHRIGAEIVEACWVDPRDPGDLPVAPLSRDAVWPSVVWSAGQRPRNRSI
ncbi:NUDIX domain-containing protein [Aeromicrobium sp. CF4.19]|uniref:NUDIX hydrolase n=1 Tax=Aeromicrobium sp. CF4.19 TaxID=3373082 RepID=UPI003EE7A42B